MAQIAMRALARKRLNARLQQADVMSLPYASGSFDTVINTMAFSGYPDGFRALAELRRVLRPGGRLILLDVNYPPDGNLPGMLLTRMWIALGDIVRDLGSLLEALNLSYRQEAIGGLGTVHLYLATREAPR
jgi:ubiquinone/menaquinone biosynthesis C-methylase UbiE